MYRQKIVDAIQSATGEKNPHIEVPTDAIHGDYSSNVAMVTFPDAKKTNAKLQNPRQFAEELVGKLKKAKELAEIVEKIEIAGPGFINFWLKGAALVGNLSEIKKKGDKFGKSNSNQGKRVIVEYSSPNIAKPFTVGHLRSTVIGDAIANLLDATGWEVLRDNHLGDWGTQFGKQIYAIKTWGNEEKITKADNPVKELVALYVKFHKEAEKDDSLNDRAREWFKKLEDGDPQARRLWKLCVDWSWDGEFNKIYKRLGIKGFFKEFAGGKGLGESFFEDKMGVVIAELEKKKLLKEGKEGAKLVFFKKDKYPPAMILKKDGTTLYHTRDLATDKYRLEKLKPDLIINEVGADQKLYFEQLFEMEELLGWYKKSQRVHVYHGFIRFKDGKISTRKGTAIWLGDVLDEAENRARELGSEGKALVSTVSVGALKYNDLKRDPKTEIVFDWDEILNMQGNSGPYLQYTFARTQSVLAKVKNQNAKFKMINRNLRINSEESSLLRSFIHFPEVVEEAAQRYAPNLLCNYLYNLAQIYNSFYNEHKIIGGKNEELGLELTFATGQILKNGLSLLGIAAPEKM